MPELPFWLTLVLQFTALVRPYLRARLSMLIGFLSSFGQSVWRSGNVQDRVIEQTHALHKGGPYFVDS